ncbi:unnamed protein product [Lepeophtheirus salmonis]|uniref:(salmon louse) hypothetical protein n=1 Tax=Lepeophtheirus salmonis TaxID=72036 RepID=A0A7R8CSU9_LEPSM|nr:unnamed protein product [Lepeophtheirus salmonis]CAF2919576.1 unnamed protein product [Lepeophtheirus salmonis]
MNVPSDRNTSPVGVESKKHPTDIPLRNPMIRMQDQDSRSSEKFPVRDPKSRKTKSFNKSWYQQFPWVGQEIAHENKEYLKCLFKYILWFATIKVPMRAHEETDESQTFTGKRSIDYTSKTRVNDIIQVIAQNTCKIIYSEIKDAGMFSALIDESKDAAKREELALASKELQSRNISWTDVLYEVERTGKSVLNIDDNQIQAKVNEYCDKICLQLEQALTIMIEEEFRIRFDSNNIKILKYLDALDTSKPSYLSIDTLGYLIEHFDCLDIRRSALKLELSRAKQDFSTSATD